MKFPLNSAIITLPYGNKTGAILRIDGNAGQIPPSFAYAVLTTPADGSSLCDQGVSPMTEAQWEAWTDQESGTYILSTVAANLDLTLAAPAAKKSHHEDRKKH